jgi:hypothetical protein
MTDVTGIYTRHQLETPKERDHLEGVNIGKVRLSLCITN